MFFTVTLHWLPMKNTKILHPKILAISPHCRGEKKEKSIFVIHNNPNGTEHLCLKLCMYMLYNFRELSNAPKFSNRKQLNVSQVLGLRIYI